MNTNSSDQPQTIQTKSVTFKGRTLVVSKATLESILKIHDLEAAGTEYIVKSGINSPALVAYYVEIYPAMAACTKAEDGQPIPLPQEILDSEPQESNEWYKASRELNPSLFPDYKNPPKDTQEKKRKKRKS